jgi:predicted DNA binding protein
MWATILQAETPACSWCRHASTNHPGVGLKVLSYYARQGGNALEVVEMTGEGWPAVVKDIQGIETVDEVEVLDSNPREARVRIAARHCALPAAIEASGIVPQLPFEVAGGCDRWLLLTEKEHAKTFFDRLREEGVAVRVAYSGEYSPSMKLTPRQQEVLEAATRHGYYDYPRRVTLTQLAARLGVAKSTLSQSLAMIESEVMRAVDPLAVRPR